MNLSNTLVIIPARGGSKGIPHKNIKNLGGKPLIYYSIDVARKITNDDNICISSDDEEIIRVVEDYGLYVPFKRPDFLATDTSGSNEVILHALDFYERMGKYFDKIILLQPTSPFRKEYHIEEALTLYNKNIDMVVSVKETIANPYYNCFEENENGFLETSKKTMTEIVRRQDAPKCWEFNGSIYVINPVSLKEKGMSSFSKRVPYEMSAYYSIDLDTLFDWKVAELILNEGLVDIE